MKKTNAILTLLVILLIHVNLSAQENIRFKVDALSRNSTRLAEKERFSSLTKMYMDYQLQTFPELGAYLGKRTDNSKWTDMTMAAIELRKTERAAFLKAIQSINRSALEASDQLNYDLLQNTLALEKEGEKFPSELMPIEQMAGYHQQIMQVTRIIQINNKQDVDDFLTRLQNVAALVDQLIILMDEGIRKGITPARNTLTGVPEQIANLIGNDPARSPLLKNLTDYLRKEKTADAQAVAKKAITIITGSVNPSLQKLKSYVEKNYIPKARESVALKSLPNGADWYNYNIKVQTTTSLSYRQIHDIGLKEVKRIRSAMDTLIRATGFHGSFEEFVIFLRTDPQFFYEDSAALLDGYRVISKKIDGELPRLFGKLPRLPYHVLPIPEFDEKFQTTAYYLPGSNETGRAGVFYANTYDLKSRPKWEMEALTIHEAVPGHHLQIALASELENVPEFRKYMSFTSFVEGWGLYSESLGEEMGFYKDPYSKFGQLTYEMWRAVRLVVDTGIHGLGWSRQEAIDFFKANAAKTEHDITVEVDRYIAWPGQALAYKIGELKIKELRARAKQKLGERFDIRKFHDVVLANGAIPLNILEEKVDQWIISVH